MKKLTTTLASALAVLLLASGVWAETWTGLSEEELDELAMWLAAEEMDDATYESQFDGAGVETLDRCFYCRPVAYYVAFYDGSQWNGTNEVSWNSTNQTYQVCWNASLMEDVYGVRQYWKNSTSFCCSYCDSGTFDEGDYFEEGSGYEKAETRTCGINIWPSSYRWYRAEEVTWYSDHQGGYDFNPYYGNDRIGRMDTWLQSYINIVACPE